MSATDLVAFSRGRRRTRGGDCRRGNPRLLTAAEMRLKTSGSDRGGRSAGGDGGGESRGAGSAPAAPVEAEAEEGTGPGLLPPPAGGGEKGSATPPPVSCGLTPPGSPRLARLGAWRFAGPGSSTRGGALGQLGPVEEPVWPSWPAR